MEAYQISTFDANKKIIVARDDEATGATLLEALEQRIPHKITRVTSGMQVLEQVDTLKPDLLILNFRLPDMTGLEVYDTVYDSNGHHAIPTILLDADLPWQHLGNRNIICLNKPLDANLLLQALDTLVLFPHCPVSISV